MGKKLVIVESPHKARTIQKYLGSEYKVEATMGHIRDLAIGMKECHLGVDVENDFYPYYQICKGKARIVGLLKKLVSETNQEDIYLATDPDREGEAISWHLADELKLDINKTKRLEFHEVTYHAIIDAINNPRTINMDLVHSQEARRIIDRILGFKLSNLMKNKIGAISAGRVQSVVTRMIVERQKAIDEFISKDYYIVNGSLNVDGVNIPVSVVDENKNDVHFDTLEDALKAIEEINNSLIKVSDISIEEKTRASKPVYTTSTLQQDASNILRFNSKKTMELAQELYEGLDLGNGEVGLITYMRTDSVRITPSFINKTKDYIASTYGEDYVGVAKVFNKSKDNVQDAHEGIRPTDLANVAEMFNNIKKSENKVDDLRKLYNLIYNRTVASVMKDEKYIRTEVLFNASKYNLLAVGEKQIFDGFCVIDGKNERVPLKKEVTFDSNVSVNKLVEKASKTKGPSPFTEATLISQMEKDGIGRPSTYAATLYTIKSHKYADVVKNFYQPTETGVLVVDKLVESFEEYVDISYTAMMETSLDEIALGSKDEKNYLHEFYDKFNQVFAVALKEMETTRVIKPVEVVGVCPTCGNDLIKKNGKNGEFIACKGFPSCRYTASLAPKVGEKCPKCQEGFLKVRKGPKGQFYGCSCYPKCNYVESITVKKSFK